MLKENVACAVSNSTDTTKFMVSIALSAQGWRGERA